MPKRTISVATIERAFCVVLGVAIVSCMTEAHGAIVAGRGHGAVKMAQRLRAAACQDKEVNRFEMLLIVVDGVSDEVAWHEPGQSVRRLGSQERSV